ncbi:MAG: enoyl-CoA hydratase/isomerase family protein [Bacteroidetes bacterium]|nr:enoyl-CoA hydratase/isomerase family protein [Bacteroidota bacterium]MCW5896336.1 enoyl-CoA hydratase/isomerase family protein [Bacteroidota bacterium]
MQFSRLLYEASNRKATITLNRPEKRNALDDAMVGELGAAFQQAARDQNVKVITLRGAGPAFCAGADLEYLSRIAKYDLEENRADSTKLAHLFKTIYELRKPVIAAVHGPALAGGCGLASVCDIVIASEENASFGYTEVRIGFIPAIVLVFLIKRVGEGKARELVLRGHTLSAQEAAAIGLVNITVPAISFEPTIEKLVSDLLQNNSLHAMGLCKEMLSKLHGLNLMEAIDFAANMNAAARMTPDCKEGIAAFLNKEKLQW